MKLLSVDPQRRPNDVADLQGPGAMMSKQDLKNLEQLLILIQARGATRGRDLREAFDLWLAPWLPQ